jgi:hypothetical protein
MFKTFSFWLFMVILCTQSSFVYAKYTGSPIQNRNQVIDPSSRLLPTNLRIYLLQGGGATINKEGSTGEERLLPTVNSWWLANPGCYIACTTSDETQSVYPLGNGTYVVGQIRVPGQYKDGLCVPRLKKDEDLGSSKGYKYLCNVKFNVPCKEESCWAEAKTGQWFDEGK